MTLCVFRHMQDFVKAIHDTPIPNLLIASGLLFLLLGFVNKLGGFIEVSREQKRLTIPIGLLVLTIGLTLSVSGPSGMERTSPQVGLETNYVRAITNDPNPPTNLRNGPGSNYDIVARVQKGEVFLVDLQSSGEWLPVKTSDNQYGYIHKPLVREVK